MSKFETADFSEHFVCFPTTEKAYALVNSDKIPFSKAVMGVTLPSPNYYICRSEKSEITVFEYVLEGEGKICLDGQWHTAKAGDFYILVQGERHRYQADPKKPWKKLWINYTAGYIPTLMASYGVKSGIYRSNSARTIFEQLIQLTKSHGDKTEISFSIAEKINTIIKIAAIETAHATDDGHGIKKYISAYVHEKFNFDELAEAMHMSKSNVIRLFKKEYGVTPYEYLLGLKIETAKALLKDTNLPIKKIADKLCIADEHYFSSLFLKRVGLRPGAYRKMHHETIFQ